MVGDGLFEYINHERGDEVWEKGDTQSLVCGSI